MNADVRLRWDGTWRDETWARLGEPLDVLIIGGGITGAGILLEAARLGLRASLVEQGDFASGTSSQSAKLVHGGMRYLRQGRAALTRALLLERDRLLAEHPGLVDPLDFVLPTYRDRWRDRMGYAAGVRLYDLLRGRRRTWRRHSADEMVEMIPGIRTESLDGGYGYLEAVTDDARLVLRTLREAAHAGAGALNYVRAHSLIRDGGRVRGAELADVVGGRSITARARAVVNATGVHADRLRGELGATPRLRPIRGSHLVVSRDVLPLSLAVGLRHPATGRYLYLLPWEGVTLVGTTDLDDPEAGRHEPRATPEEVSYLLEGVDAWLPGIGLSADHLLGTFAGVRPVVGTGRADPYREGRDSVLWEEEGLLTVVSGKLTGFRPIVERALRRVVAAVGPSGRGSGRLGPSGAAVGDAPAAEPGGPPAALAGVPDRLRHRLLGRYGDDMLDLAAIARDGDLEPVAGTPVLWAELRWAARAEGVVHLDDLLLRRARVGLLLPRGGEEIFPRLAALCREELGWGEERWVSEVGRYRSLWREGLSVPGRSAAGDAPASKSS